MILFDLDGTLADTRYDLTSAANAMREAFDLPPLPMETVVSYVGNGLMKLVERALADAPSPVSLTTGADRFREYYSANLLDQTVLYPGVSDLLKQLNAMGIPMGVVSNKPEMPARQVCAGLGIEHAFEFIFGGDSFPTKKPCPEPLLAAIKLTGDVAAESWMVGDNYTDIGAARAAGMRSCYCEYGFGDLKEEKPDLRIQTPIELLSALSGSGVTPSALC